MAYGFRPATLADAAGIARLGVFVFENTFGHAVPSHDLEEYLGLTYTPSAISAGIENSERNIFVAVDQEGNIRGFSTLALQTTKPCVEAIEGTVELQRMYVDTTFMDVVLVGGSSGVSRTQPWDMVMKHMAERLLEEQAYSECL